MFSPKGFNGKLSKKKNFQMQTLFFNNSDRDFYSVNNNVYTYKNTKKVKKKTTLLYRLYAPFCAKHCPIPTLLLIC
jgi:hypothetical protein